MNLNAKYSQQFYSSDQLLINYQLVVKLLTCETHSLGPEEVGGQFNPNSMNLPSFLGQKQRDPVMSKAFNFYIFTPVR